MPTHKTLENIARGVAESFTSLMNYWGDDYVMGHIVYAAWETGGTEIRVNLLTGDVGRSPLLVPPVRASVEGYVQRFPDLVHRSRSDIQLVKAAELLVVIDPNKRRNHAGGGYQKSPFTCTVRITDDRGKLHGHEIAGWWYPEKTPPS